MKFKAATITLSDRCARGEQEDTSGQLLRKRLVEIEAELLPHLVLPDEQTALSQRLVELSEQCDVIITTGGTGISPKDVTPEATLEVVERRIPGIEEALHLFARDKVPTSILSRAVAGIRGNCIIVNLPGSPGGVEDGMKVLSPIIAHAVRLVKGQVSDCRTDRLGSSE